jgi:hypothetical protein
MMPVAPDAPAVSEDVEIVGEQDNPACVMLIVSPPTVMVAVRAALDELAATLNCTVPCPVMEGVVIVSQGAELTAVHPQLLPVSTLTLP